MPEVHWLPATIILTVLRWTKKNIYDNNKNSLIFLKVHVCEMRILKYSGKCYMTDNIWPLTEHKNKKP